MPLVLSQWEGLDAERCTNKHTHTNTETHKHNAPLLCINANTAHNNTLTFIDYRCEWIGFKYFERQGIAIWFWWCRSTKQIIWFHTEDDISFSPHLWQVASPARSSLWSLSNQLYATISVGLQFMVLFTVQKLQNTAGDITISGGRRTQYQKSRR